MRRVPLEPPSRRLTRRFCVVACAVTEFHPTDLLDVPGESYDWRFLEVHRIRGRVGRGFLVSRENAFWLVSEANNLQLDRREGIDIDGWSIAVELLQQPADWLTECWEELVAPAPSDFRVVIPTPAERARYGKGVGS